MNIVLVLVALVAGIGCVVSLVVASENPTLGTAGALGAIAVIIASSLASQRLKARALAQRDADDTARLPKLIEHIESGLQTLAVKSHSFFRLIIVVVMTLVSVVSIWYTAADPGPQAILLTGIAVLATLVMLLICIPTLGGAALIISARGVEPATYGFIPWEEIDGIDLYAIRMRHQTHYSLKFLVPGLAARRDQMRPAMRMLYPLLHWGRARSVASVQLHGDKENPEMLKKLCQQLWVRRTGKRRWWSAMGSDHLNEMAHRLEQRKVRIDDALEQRDAQAASRHLDEMAEDMKQLYAPGKSPYRAYNGLVILALVVLVIFLVILILALQ